MEMGGETDIVFHADITHNLAAMAQQATLYLPLWRPEQLGFSKASQLVFSLEIGLKFLVNDPETYKAFNPENGWGDYDGLVKFVQDYLNACVQYPDADIEVSR